jgi:two-component system cell cycle sensor histidine kinase/response regulator CckA
MGLPFSPSIEEPILGAPRPSRTKRVPFWPRTRAFPRPVLMRTLHPSYAQQDGDPFEHIFDLTGVGMAQVGLDGRWLRVNQRLCDIVGYSRDEMLARTFVDITHPEDLDKHLEELRRTLAGETARYEIDKRYVHSGGRPIWIRLSVSLVRTPEGEPGYFVTAIQDIGALKQTDEALRYSERRFRSMTENAVDMITVVDRAGVYQYLSPAAERVLGYRVADRIGRSAFEDLHPADLPLAHQALGDILGKPSQSARFETRNRHANGAWRHLEVVATNLLDDPAVHGIVVNSRDVTERRESECALVEAQGRLQHLIAASPVGLYVLEPMADGDGARRWGLAWIGDGVERVMGYRREEALDSEWFASNLHPDHLGAKEAAIDEIQSTGRTVQEYQFRQQDGTYRWIRDELRAIVDGDRLIEIVGAWTDVTAQREAADALRRTETQLRQAQKMDAVGRLAGGVAHDFNNLLTGIGAYTDLALQETAPDSQIRADLQEVKHAVARAATLTRQLLAFSRQQVLDPQALDLTTVVRGIEGMLARLLNADVTVTTRLADDLPSCLADRGQMEQVLLNLAVNARQAMPGGGRITITTEALELDADYVRRHPDVTAGPHVVLRVSDTGVGMDDCTLARIYEPFFTTKREGEGTGLGLSTVYGIVKQFGGSIAVESALGVGTTFHIYLPVAVVPSEHADARDCGSTTAEHDVDPERRERGVILLVEDNPSVRAVTRELLERHGHTVLEAEHGEVALRILEDHTRHVDLLVSDVVMPVLGGLQLLPRAQALRPGLRAVLMSGFTGDSMLSRGSLPSGITFLEKPYERDVLLATVSDLLQATRHVAPRGDMLAPTTVQTVVVIDDTELNRVLACMTLEGICHVVTHEGGPAAVQLLADLAPDLVLLDIAMPDLDGFAVLARIRAHATLHRTRVIAFTSRDTDDDQRAYRDAGFDGFLRKPIADLEVFRDSVRAELCSALHH